MYYYDTYYPPFSLENQKDKFNVNLIQDSKPTHSILGPPPPSSGTPLPLGAQNRFCAFITLTDSSVGEEAGGGEGGWE